MAHTCQECLRENARLRAALESALLLLDAVQKKSPPGAIPVKLSRAIEALEIKEALK